MSLYTKEQIESKIDIIEGQIAYHNEPFNNNENSPSIINSLALQLNAYASILLSMKG